MNKSYRLLFAVPKRAIIHRLRQVADESSILGKCKVIDEGISSLSDLTKASHDVLIQIVSLIEEFSEEDALNLHEEYRYRGTKTLYIYLYPTSQQATLSSFLDSDNSEVYQRLAANISDEDIAGLRFRDIAHFSIDKDFIWEIVYSYVTYLQAIDPDTEEKVQYPDLRYGFLWINLVTPWAIISSPDEKVARIFERVLREAIGLTINRMPIPEEAERAVESYEGIRRATHVDHRGIKRRVYHQSLSQFEDALEEVQSRDREQARWNSGYNAEIDGVQFVINYSREKGALSFSKWLPTSLLRKFVVQKINELYAAVQDIISNAPDQMVSLVVDHHLRGYPSRTKENIKSVLNVLATARVQGVSEIPINNIVELSNLRKFFKLSIESECNVCSNVTHLQCQHCQSERLVVVEEALKCLNCGTINQLACENGHGVFVSNPHEVVVLYPKSSLLEIVEKVFSTLGDVPSFNRYEEGFFIRNGKLHIFGKHGEKVVYLLDDIPEFQEVANLSLTDDDLPTLYSLLREYREKCDYASDSNCQQCVLSRVGEKCFLRLFGLFTDKYVPRPHGGSEFGDVSFDITLDGRPNQRLVILLKRGNPNGRAITLRRPIGKDVYTQLENLWGRPEIDILGIGVPQRLAEEFVSKIKRRAHDAGKRILFLERDALARIVKYVMAARNLTPQDL